MSTTSMFSHQLRVDLIRFWRNSQSRYFTLLLPIIFLVIFAAIFKGETVVDGHKITISTFYVPGIMTLGIVSASYLNLTQTVVDRREGGELKRLRGTPLPALYVIASRALVGVVVAVVMSVLLLVIGRVAYKVNIPSALGALALGVIVGAAAFACIGFAVSSIIRSSDAAAPALNLSVLPLYFISGVFVPEAQIPSFLHKIAEIFPIYHLAAVLRQPFLESGKPMKLGDLAVVAAWGLACLLIAARTFRWTPSSEG
jgi:ABC-2 type transport system permease protein